ncbi:unnamed protein product [Auanema sp. JU1783]|nr:unnamed protein product [Auanema sp. JU1783]
MDRRKFSVGRQSLLASHTNQKTPTRQRFSGLQTPLTAKRDARFSLGAAPAARRMSVFKQPNAMPRVDTSDKKYQQEMIAKIYDFIVELDGEEAVTIQHIAKPTQKDFIGFLEMIYECLSGNYEVGDRKIAEEIPRLFSCIGYPYAIKPSYLQPVGASHNWHYLLHALCWLIDQVKISAKLEEVVGSQILLSGDNSNGNIGAFRYSWLQDHFKTCHHNKQLGLPQGTYEEEHQNLKDWFQNQDDIGGQLKAAEAAFSNLRKENAELENENGNEDKYIDDNKKLEDDIRKAKAYCEAMDQATRNSEKEKENAIFDLEEVKSEVEGIREALQEKKRIMNEQERGAFGISGPEARAMMAEFDQNRVLIREVQNELEALGRERWNIQPKESQGFAHLLSRYSHLRESIRSIRSEVLGDSSVSTDTARDIREVQQLLNNQIRPLINSTYSGIEAKKSEIRNEIGTVRQKINSFDIRMQVENEKLADSKRMLKRNQLSYQRKTEDQCHERQNVVSKIENLENEKEMLERNQRDITKMEQDLEMARRDLYDTKEKINEGFLSFEEHIASQLSGPAEIIDRMRIVVVESEKTMAEFLHNFYKVHKELRT